MDTRTKTGNGNEIGKGKRISAIRKSEKNGMEGINKQGKRKNRRTNGKEK